MQCPVGTPCHIACRASQTHHGFREESRQGEPGIQSMSLLMHTKGFSGVALQSQQAQLYTQLLLGVCPWRPCRLGSPALQSAPCSDTEQERNPPCGEPTPAVPFRRLLWFPAEEQQGASSLLTSTTCGSPAATSATPEKQRRNPTAPRPFPELRTPRSHLAGCKWPGTLRGAEKEMTYYCLLFCSANREAFLADGTRGNVAQNRDKESATGNITSIR